MRLAELVVTMSLATDLGMGQPMEHVLRQTRIALRLAEAAGLEEADRAAGIGVAGTIGGDERSDRLHELAGLPRW